MRIGLTYDLKEAVPLDPSGPEDALEEYDYAKTVELLSAAISSAGHSVVRLGGGKEFLENILREKTDFVFNIAEGRGSYRSREAQVPSVLEMLNIPYSGSDPQCLAVCLDKPLTKKIVALAGVHVPQELVIADAKELKNTPLKAFPYPAIVKPAWEGSSKGVRLTSVAGNAGEAADLLAKMLEDYHQPAMIEEFITGDEVTVGIIGNNPPEVLGMMRILPRKKYRHFVYSLEVKRDWRNTVEYECPAKLDREVLEKIRWSSLSAFKALGCRDFARMDFRINAQGNAYFLEINPLPGLGDYSDLVIMAQRLGWTYNRLISAVLDAALGRYASCPHG
jgi:D-alanine-D-alanine ligase